MLKSSLTKKKSIRDVYIFFFGGGDLLFDPLYDQHCWMRFSEGTGIKGLLLCPIDGSKGKYIHKYYILLKGST